MPFAARPATVRAAGMPRIKKTLSKGRLSAIISAPAKALRMAPMRPTPCIQLEPVARYYPTQARAERAFMPVLAPFRQAPLINASIQSKAKLPAA